MQKHLIGVEGIRIIPTWRIYKFNENPEIKHDLALQYNDLRGYCDDFKEFRGNILLFQGASLMISGFTGLVSGTENPFDLFNNTNALIVIGDSSTAAAATDTGPIGTNFNLPMDATYPQYNSVNEESVIWRATADGSTGNQAWNEFLLSNGNNAMNRKVEPSGTKVSPQIWIAELIYTFA